MRYFFHLREGDRLTRDAAGAPLPDLTSAIDAAKRRAAEFVDKAALTGRAIQWGTEYEVEDAAGRLVMVLPLSHFVEIGRAA
ncbi:MAG: DUF6894 family protein [Rhizobiaceae bacterium]|jgi:hypothetical protein